MLECSGTVSTGSCTPSTSMQAGQMCHSLHCLFAGPLNIPAELMTDSDHAATSPAREGDSWVDPCDGSEGDDDIDRCDGAPFDPVEV